MDIHSNNPGTVLVTGIHGFTGEHLRQCLIENNYKVYGLVQHSANEQKNELNCDITHYKQVQAALQKIKPDYIIHLAAISFVAHENSEEMYRVNLFGTLNTLQAIIDLQLAPKKILIASSANIYGNPKVDLIDENCCPLPINHYANSKLAMENMVRTYFAKLPIIIARPFNYTGVGQSASFLVPKIIAHYKRREKVIELGNTDVIRDFSDVRFVVSAYQKLLESTSRSVLVNICSGQGYSLSEILNYMNELAGYNIEVRNKSEFMRDNEIKKLVGSNKLLFELIGRHTIYNLFDTLTTMYRAD